MSQFFPSGGQSIGASASTLVLPMNIQDWFLLGWTGLISLQSKRFSRVFSNTTVQKHQFFSFIVQLAHPYMTTGKTKALTRWTFVDKVLSLLFNMLSRLIITFLPRSKHLLISWLQSPSASDFGAPKNKICHCFHCFPIYFLWSDGKLPMTNNLRTNVLKLYEMIKNIQNCQGNPEEKEQSWRQNPVRL